MKKNFLISSVGNVSAFAFYPENFILKNKFATLASQVGSPLDDNEDEAEDDDDESANDDAYDYKSYSENANSEFLNYNATTKMIFALMLSPNFATPSPVLLDSVQCSQ